MAKHKKKPSCENSGVQMFHVKHYKVWPYKQAAAEVLQLQPEDKVQIPSSFAEQSFFASECATSATEQKRLYNNGLRNSFPKSITLRAPQCDIPC